MARARLRRLWRNVHLAVALGLGAILAIIGLTGALLVCKGPILEWELGSHAVRVVAQPNRPFAPTDLWISRSQRAYPALAHVMGVDAPGAGFLPVDAAMVFGTLTPSRHLGVVTVNPYTAEPLALLDYDTSVLAAIIEMHRRLLLPMQWGSKIVGWCGIAMLVSLASGLYLWWPPPRQWRSSLTIRRSSTGTRRLREFHNVVAAYLFIPLLVLAATGVLLVNPFGGAAASAIRRDAALLHANLMLGKLGASLVLLAGLALPTLYATGLLLWLAKRSARRVESRSREHAAFFDKPRA